MTTEELRALQAKAIKLAGGKGHIAECEYEDALADLESAAVKALPHLLAIAEAAKSVIDHHDLDWQESIVFRKPREVVLREALNDLESLK